MKLAEIKGNLKTWNEQRNALIKKLNNLDKRTDKIESKLKKYEEEDKR